VPLIYTPTGTTVLFWLDVWNDNLLPEKFPRLFTFAKNQKNYVPAFLEPSDLAEHFHLPLSDQAFHEFQELQELVQGIQLNDEGKDQWHYIWGSQKYRSKSFYSHLYRNFQPPRVFPWIWDSRCSNKLRVFTWLLLMNRLNTRNILKRKKFKIEGNNYDCVLCNSHNEETAMHLFFTCPFAKSCWQLIGLEWHLGVPFFQMIESAKQSYNNNFFMEIFIIAAWQIWKQRNDLIFENRPASLNSWRRSFKDECTNQAVGFKVFQPSPCSLEFLCCTFFSLLFL